MELVLVRHAQPVRVDQGTVSGPADPGLSRQGHLQAARLADWLAEEPIGAVLTSPLRRARETAAPVAATLGVTAEVVDGVAEYDAAAGEYIPIEELRAAKDERWFATVEGRWADVGGVDPREFQARVVPAVETLIDRFGGQRVVVVTHGGVLNVYLAHVVGTERLLWFHPEYTSISRVAAARTGQRSIATLNETAHLTARRVPSEEVPL
ncbi:MAG TPA: histidine phosphatase family protein [Acidimicrobiia bacterium]|nr:histidine phosphatase family protein [Acidimicrobiia bacterium]